MARLRVAVVGVGHLGKEHARILATLPEVELVGVVDVNIEQAETVAQQCGTTAFTAYWPLLNLVDAAVIAVPTIYHHAIASHFLCRGIPLLVEKPLAASASEAEALVALGRRYGALLQVGHIERFNPAFEELQRRPIQPKFIECRRIGPFTGRSIDIGAVLDLMIHDLDLLRALLRAPVSSVEAVGATLLGGHEDLVQARLTFATGCVAHLSASRISPHASRHMSIWAPEGHVSIDFARRRLTLTEPSEQLRRHGFDARGLAPAARAAFRDELFSRHLRTVELECNPPGSDQLTRELEHFVTCVRTKRPPRVNGEDGWQAVLLADRILERINNHEWNGRRDGPIGAGQLPTPLGSLIETEESRRAA